MKGNGEFKYVDKQNLWSNRRVLRVQNLLLAVVGGGRMAQ